MPAAGSPIPEVALAAVRGPQRHSEALSLVLLHELLRVNNGATAHEPIAYSGLVAWQ